MKKIILMLILVVFIMGCSEQIEKTPEVGDTVEEPTQKPEPKEIEEIEIFCPDYDVNKEECLLHQECKWTSGENICEPIDIVEEEDSEEETLKPIPASYHMENVPYYGELGFCYGSSAMMILKYGGFTEEQVQQYRTAVKSGLGGPPDMFTGFMGTDVLEEVKIGYSKNYNKEYADFHNEFLDPEQTILFDDGNKAFEKLKKLISSNIPVIILVHNGNHYVVAIGYDNEYIYTNDPGLDNEWDYKIDSEENLKQRRIQINTLFDEWSIKGFDGGGIGFPGDYGMIWLDKGIQKDDKSDNDEEGCARFDDNQEECLLHKECKWMSDENECESIDDSKGDEDSLQIKNWRSETVDDNGWVGIDSSIAVDTEGNPYICHYDQANRNLKYAYFSDSSWNLETIDSQGDIGEECGMAVDNQGKVHVSYIDVTNGGLKYAQKEGSLWNKETVDKKSGAHVVTTSIALDSTGNPHIAYNMESPDGDKVKYASWDGHSWKIEELATSGVDVYLTLDSNDNPHIAFRKDDSGDKSRIYYAKKSSGKWNIKIVDSSTIAGGDCGIDVDSNNYPHITYRDYSKGAIKYAKWEGTSWNIRTVAVNVGKEEGLRITVDANDRPNIIYSDNKNELLMYAVWDGNSWTKETINKMGIPSIVIDYLGRIHVSHGYTPDDERDRDGDGDEEREILKYSVRE